MTEEVKQQKDPTKSIAEPAEPMTQANVPINALGAGQQDSRPKSEPVAEEREAADELVDLLDELPRLPRLSRGRVRTRRLVIKEQSISGKSLTPEQRLLLLDTWRRSGLSGSEFEALVGISKHTLYAWKQRFEQDGPAGLMPRQRGRDKASRLPQATQRAILMLKADNRIGVASASAMCWRAPRVLEPALHRWPMYSRRPDTNANRFQPGRADA